MNQLRAFIAIETPEGVRSRVTRLIERLRAADAAVKWVEPKNLHWTLKFLGDVEMAETPEICRRMAEVAARFEPIEVAVGGLGAFPDLKRPRTVWVGASEGQEALAALNEALEESLAEMGFNRERRRFSAHLTIGRVRSSKNVDQLTELIEKSADFTAGGTVADEIVLVSSQLERGGPLYDIMGRAELGE
jgi:2'-5' RNA ligase